MYGERHAAGPHATSHRLRPRQRSEVTSLLSLLKLPQKEVTSLLSLLKLSQRLKSHLFCFPSSKCTELKQAIILLFVQLKPLTWL